MSSTNPFLGMAIFSLMNALELYQKSEERHRFGAVILMDLSVEYVLKAKLYELNPAKFIESQQDLGFADVMKDDKIKFVGDEEMYLWRVHNVRNFAQHRGSIPDSLVTRQYMQWLCMFVKRFSWDNFQLNINLPPSLNGTWTKLTHEAEKVSSIKPLVLNKPIDENYRSVKNWIRQREKNSRRGRIVREYGKQLLFHLEKYCEFMRMTPDEIIEDAKGGLFHPEESLQEFLKTLGTSYSYRIAIKSFYQCNGIDLSIPVPEYQPIHTTKEITTEQLRKLCEVADPETKSWILANSYMGLSVGEIVMLKVEDFHTENWSVKKPIYPVKIRKEVSNFSDYTAFIGADAKEQLEKYFNESNFNPQDHPWNYVSHVRLDGNFRKYASQIQIYEIGTLTPKSLTKRLKRILSESGMPYEWVCYILGLKPYRGAKTDRPLDEEITKAYEKALSKLKVFET